MKAHGKHNKTVCDMLYLQDKYPCNDWVVTTAFYSAIHFLDHKIFPCEYRGEKYKNINEAHQRILRQSKHQTRSLLINHLLPKHKADYEFLLEKSQNARYVNYDVHDSISKRAVSNLDRIIETCA